jgi:hypothetical protein
MRGAYKALFVLRDGRTGVKILAGAGCLWQCQSHKPQTALTRPDAIIVVGLRIMLEKVVYLHGQSPLMGESAGRARREPGERGGR